MAAKYQGVTTVRRLEDFDRWLQYAVEGKTCRHQLWLGRSGTGKTARLHKHVKNTIGHDMFPHMEGRVEAPIYSGRITPAKWYVRGWQHHLDPLLLLNDVDIRRVDGPLGDVASPVPRITRPADDSVGPQAEGRARPG